MPEASIDRSRDDRPVVLYVDDDSVDVASVRRAIDRRGLPLDFRSAPDLATARRILDESEVALMLVDQSLGDGRGIDLLKSMPGIASIILTGGGSEELAAEALRRGAADYVVKRSDGSHLDGLLGSIMATLGSLRAERARAEAARDLADAYRELEVVTQGLDRALSAPLQRLEELGSRLREQLPPQFEEARASTAEIEAIGRGGFEVVRQLTRLATLNPSAEQSCRVEFSDVVRRAARRIAIDYPDRVEVMLDASHPIQARPNQLQMAIESVLEFAAKHRHPDGRPVSVLATCECDEDWVEMQFIDGGIDIGRIDRDEVFTICGRGDLGSATPELAVFDRVARLHGGTARVDDGIDGFACFRLRIPRSPR
ncbi:response regulator [Engelhardtia mirabilis]|uniref:histidine kinase n=1 Tax=Engelhardtia mirabilis TaxID=2528011 RepID=A0A518BI53_9BACT|nr:Photosynthetic apparatus regulatory protein RegA [Planctomycetes bacterium Pla133]QDV00972.1 Photosynthetic apparatus regulatory protein RegA [Planctomycetes bacterium Pla86]